MDAELHEELKDCDTLNEMWTTLNEYYDLNTKLGVITQKLVVAKFAKNMGKMLRVTRTPKK